jgi:hypothetical protein
VVELLIVLVVLVAVVLLVSAPLRRGRVEEVVRRESVELAELEAAKAAKYREIRDAEMDYRTGKLSAEDHRVLDRGLRAEAIDILRRIDRVKGSGGAEAGAGADVAPAGDPSDPRVASGRMA